MVFPEAIPLETYQNSNPILDPVSNPILNPVSNPIPSAPPKPIDQTYVSFQNTQESYSNTSCSSAYQPSHSYSTHSHSTHAKSIHPFQQTHTSYPLHTHTTNIYTQSQQQPQIRSQSNTFSSDTSSFLGGYLVGEDIKRGDYGSAMLMSSLSGSSGNNYNNGLMIGLMTPQGKEGKEEKKHHKPKHEKSSSGFSGSYGGFSNGSSGNSFANMTTR